jgi:hypothetical protein
MCDHSEKMRQDSCDASGATSREPSTDPDQYMPSVTLTGTTAVSMEPRLSAAGEQMEREHKLELEREEHQKKKKARRKRITSVFARVFRRLSGR